MAGDSAAVSEMHRPGLLHPALACPGPPSAYVGKGLPCGHCPGCSMSPLIAVPLGALVPLPRSGLFSAGKSLPTLQPLPGILPSATSRGVSQRLGVPRDSHPREPGHPRVPRPLGPLGQPPCSQSQLGCSPLQVRARLPGLRGRGAGPPGGRFFGSGLGACCWQQGRAFAERRAGASKCGLGSRGTTILLAVGCGQRQGTWAHGCGRHLGGGRRLCRAEGGRAGTTMLAGRGLRASPQGLPLRAAVLRRWVWPQGVVARTGHQSSPELPRRPGRGWLPVQVQPRPHALLRKHLGRKGEYCPVGHICSLSGDGGGGEGLLGLWP